MGAPSSPVLSDDPEALASTIVERVGKRIVLGIPLGIGKPNPFVNALYRLAERDPSIELVIATALSLNPPVPKSELERRILGPLVARLYGGYPRLAYVDALDARRLPDNVQVREFYFAPGKRLNDARSQRSYVSSNYTHALRDVEAQGLNVYATLARSDARAPGRIGLGSNPDLGLDAIAAIERARRAGRPAVSIAQTSEAMPYVGGDALLPESAFDYLLRGHDFPLFGIPKEPIRTADHVIGLHASALVKDGGTLQLGIGALSDAITEMLRLRHLDGDRYRALLDASGTGTRAAGLVERFGGRSPFTEGLYACTEMYSDAFVELRRLGILRRRVYPDADLQQALDEGTIDATPSLAMLDALVARRAIRARLDAHDVARLRTLGILAEDVRFEDGRLRLGDVDVAAELDREESRAAIGALLGRALRGGKTAHAAFFLGDGRFYDALRSASPEDVETFETCGVRFVNELYGDERLKIAQRRDARFLNTALIATIDGAIASDGLDDGRVVSGVGGQYNFVAMAHALPGARSILMLRSTRGEGDEARSNVRSSYGHTTIPRHLRDVVITEYGIADLRGQTDETVILRMIAIADSRFQDELLAGAKRAGKVAADATIPEHARNNRPERLEALLAPHRRAGALSDLPLGSELTSEEIVLARALGRLKSLGARALLSPRARDAARAALSPPSEARPYLERMDLAAPRTLEEQLLARAVLAALALDGTL